MAASNCRVISPPLEGSSSSIYVLIPAFFKDEYKWLVNVRRVSGPLKLKNTSQLWQLEDVEVDLDGKRDSNK